MDAFPIVGRYKLYKKGTERLVSWLTHTARKCTGSTKLFETLKSRSTLASEAHPNNGHNKILLTTKDIISLAILIAGDKSASIPEDVLEITKDVIAGRECCTLWYQTQGRERNRKATTSDRGHAFFINTLKNLYTILSSAKSVRACPSTTVHGDDRKGECEGRDETSNNGATADKKEQYTLRNLFMHLQVEEPPEDPFGTTTFILEEPAAFDDAEAQSREKNDKEFLIWCLFQELSDVRKYVCDVWAQYASGKKSLLAAGIITDVSFGLMRYMCEHHSRTVHEINEYWNLCKLLALDGPLDDGKNTQNLGIDNISGSNTASEHAKTLCHDAAALLSFMRANSVGLINTTTDGQPPQDADATASQSPRTGLGSKLCELLPGIVKLGQERMSYVSEYPMPMAYKLSDDELLMVVVGYVFTGGFADYLPLWLVSAVQASMDIHDVLKGKTSCGLHTLQSTIPAVTGSLDVVAKVCHGESKDEKLPWFDRHEWFIGRFHSLAAHDTEVPSTSTLGAAPAPALAQTLPSVPAVVDFHIRNNALSLGTAACNAEAAVLSMAHLYKAAHQYGLIPLAWEDLDFLLANCVATQHGSDAVLPIVTKASPNSDEYAMARHFRMALGLPAAQRERHARPNLHSLKLYPSNPLQSNCRMLKPKSALVNAFLRMQITSQMERESDMFGVIVRTLAKEGEQAGKKKKPAVSGSQTTYTPVAMLEKFDKQWKQIEPFFNFNHIMFSYYCVTLLDGLDRQYRPGTNRLPDSFKRKSYDFVDGLLWSVADTIHSAKPQSPAESTAVVQGTNFGRVINTLNGCIERSGNQYVKPAFERSSGHIPKSMWPEI